MIEINLFDVFFAICFALLLGSSFQFLFFGFSETIEKSWSWGKQSLISMGVLYIIVNFSQGYLWRYCAIQEPPGEYIIRYITPALAATFIGWFLGKAKRSKEREDLYKMKLFLLFAFIYAFGASMIPVLNILLGITEQF